MVSPEHALAGRPTPMPIGSRHVVLGTRIVPPFPDESEVAYFAMGCFWGAERRFWQLEGVHATAVGYMGGYTLNPTYAEVCTGRTGHAETVLVVYLPDRLGYGDLLAVFFEGHDPTQMMRQGNDVGTQYRSALFTTTPAQAELAEAVRAKYAARLVAAGYGPIATEIVAAGRFFYAEDEHQQYLAKNPGGYCGLGGTGIACPVGRS
jgi:peptide-methionine (S)-S-oxide reductase